MAICVWTMVLCGVFTAEALALDAATCTGLLRLSIPDTTITSAALVAADGELPEHCRVQGRVETEINFELRLPTHLEWQVLSPGWRRIRGLDSSDACRTVSRLCGR